MASLLITDAEFAMLPEDFRKVLLARFMPAAEMVSPDDAIQPAPTLPVPTLAKKDEGPADMSPAHANKASASVSAKTRNVLREIVAFPVDGFDLPDLERKLHAQPGGLKGCWTGITKVTRRVLRDEEAALIWWTRNADGTWHGRLSETTWRSFHKALGLA